MKKLLKYIYLPIILMVATVTTMIAVSCVGNGSNERIITVSIQPQRYLLEQLVGNRFKVVCLLSQGSNPEAYEPSMSYLMNLEKSEAYFCIGNIGFELAIVEKAKAENPDLRIFVNSKHVKLMRGSHGHNHQGGNEVDPHVWTSVPNAILIAEDMKNALIEIDADHAKQYEKNFAKLKAKLEGLDSMLRAQLDSVPCRSFLVWHPSLSYFARDYGMHQISMEYESKETSANRLKHEIDEAKSSGAKVFFYQKEFDSRQIETINKEIGTKMVTINPMSYDWEGEMKNIANALAAE